MAAKQPPETYPTFILRRFRDLTDAYSEIRNLVRSLENHRKEIEDVAEDHGTRLTPLTSSGTPTSTPTDTQLFNLDTVAKDMYVSVGTASSADWKKITP